MMFRLALATATVIVAASPVSIQAQEVRLKESVYDFGTVDPGDRVVAKYTVVNSVNEPIRISPKDAVCPCIALPSYVIEPQTQLDIEVSFDTSGWSGLVRTFIALNVEPLQQELSVELRGRVAGTFSLAPEMVVLRVDKGVSQSIEIQRRDSQSFAIAKVEATIPGVRVRLLEQHTQVLHRVEVTLSRKPQTTSRGEILVWLPHALFKPTLRIPLVVLIQRSPVLGREGKQGLAPSAGVSMRPVWDATTKLAAEDRGHPGPPSRAP